jgi:hypothetical protein
MNSKVPLWSRSQCLSAPETCLRCASSSRLGGRLALHVKSPLPNRTHAESQALIGRGRDCKRGADALNLLSHNAGQGTVSDGPG